MSCAHKIGSMHEIYHKSMIYAHSLKNSQKLSYYEICSYMKYNHIMSLRTHARIFNWTEGLPKLFFYCFCSLPTLQFHENSSKHPKKITLLFFIKNIFLNPGWPSYCIRRYLNTQRCTWPPENLIFQVVTEMLPTESKSQRQIGPYIIALLQNYSFLCVLSIKNISLLFLVFLYKCYIHIKYLYTQKFKFSQQRKISGQYHVILWEKWTKSSRDKKEVFSCNLPMNCWKLCNARETIKCVYCKLWISTLKKVNLKDFFSVICFKHWFTTSGK